MAKSSIQQKSKDSYLGKIKSEYSEKGNEYEIKEYCAILMFQKGMY